MSKYSIKINLVFLFVLMNCSCNSSDTENVPHAEYADKSLKKIANSNEQPFKEKGAVLADTLYNSLPHLTIRDMCNKYILKSNYFLETYDYSKAMLYADSILLLIQNNGLENKLAEFYGKAYYNKGEIFFAWKDFNSAFQYFYEARKDVEQTHDNCLYADYSSRLGSVCYNQAKYLDAVLYFKECINALPYCNNEMYLNFNNRQGNLDNIALCYDKYGMTDSAMHYFMLALDYISQHENEFPDEKKPIEIARGVIYGNLGTSYYKTGKMEDAETLFRKSININIKKGYANGDAQLTQLKLVDLYLKTERLNDAQQVLQEIKGSLDTLNAERQWRRDIEARMYKLQSDYYTHRHNPEVANSYLNSYVALKDSIDQSGKKLAGTDFNKEFENIENKYAFAVLKKNDQQKTLYLGISLIVGAMGIIITILVWKTTKRLKKLNGKIITKNAEMKTAIKALEQSQEENNRMMKIVSHDLRSPINGIIGIASMMLKDDHPEDERQMLDMIKISGLNAIEFINDLLHVNSALKEMKTELVEMAPLLQHCVDLLQFKAEEKEQEIVLETESVKLLINRQKIWRVISNLITNAIKFSPNGTTIHVVMELKPGKLIISVKDYGIGIPAHLKNDIFQMFTGAMRQGTAGEQSFGLGLAISKQIIEAHSGKISFESEPGIGTTFFIELPIRQHIEASINYDLSEASSKN